MNSLSRLLWFAAGLTVLACTPAQTVLDAGPQPLTACTSNAECASLGLECDLALLKCVCTQDSECTGTSPYCNVFTGRCEASLPSGACTSTSCPAGQYCDEGTRACAATLGFCAQCTDNAECGSGNYCIVHPDYPNTAPFCASACSASGGCAAGQSCEATSANVKQCVPTGAVCNSLPNCVADSLIPCGGANGACASGQTCNTTLMACVAATSGCAQDQACDPSTLQCVEPCGVDLDGGETGDQECQTRFGDPTFVCINSVCRAASQCAMDSECPLSEFCALSPTAPAGSLGNCEPACSSDSQCPLGELCVTDAASGRQGCQAGCASNTDCPLTAICQSGACVSQNSMGEPFCQIKQVCPFKSQCTNNVCVPEPQNCASNANGCATGTESELVAFFACGNPGCPQGTSMGICPAPSNYNPPNLNCPGQECFCSFNTCLVSGCSTDNDCASGFNCESLNGTTFCSPVNDAEACLP